MDVLSLQDGFSPIYFKIKPPIGGYTMYKIFRQLAWAWIIIIGVMMITPNGIYCIACGPMLNKLLAIASIVIGVITGAVTNMSGRAARG